jgi:hypothetical protein
MPLRTSAYIHDAGPHKVLAITTRAVAGPSEGGRALHPSTQHFLLPLFTLHVVLDCARADLGQQERSERQHPG